MSKYGQVGWDVGIVGRWFRLVMGVLMTGFFLFDFVGGAHTHSLRTNVLTGALLRRIRAGLFCRLSAGHRKSEGQKSVDPNHDFRLSRDVQAIYEGAGGCTGSAQRGEQGDITHHVSSPFERRDLRLIATDQLGHALCQC